MRIWLGLFVLLILIPITADSFSKVSNEFESGLSISNAPKLGETAELIFYYNIANFNSESPIEVIEHLNLPVGFVMVDQEEFFEPLIGELDNRNYFVKERIISDSGYYQSTVIIKAIHEGYWSISGGTSEFHDSIIYLKVGEDESIVQDVPFDDSVQMNWPSKPSPAQIEEGKPLSPKKQLAQGIAPEAVMCNEGLVLFIKYNGSPACVRHDTAVILEERGWGGMAPPSTSLLTLTEKDIEQATSSYNMNKLSLILDDFRNTSYESQDIDTIFSKFGDPSDDIGSGIHIYVYELKDSNQIWIGYSDKILYVHHVDVKGNVLETLFKNE